MNIEDITIGDARKLAALFQSQQSQPAGNTDGPWKVGTLYQIRTVTFTYTGRLVAIHPQEIVLVDAAWIPDTGRFAGACVTGEYSEVEPFPPGKPVIIGRGSIVDASIAPKINQSQK